MNVLGDFGLDSILCCEFLQGQVIAYPLTAFIRNIRENIFLLRNHEGMQLHFIKETEKGTGEIFMC